MSLASLTNQTVTHYPEVSYDRYGREEDSTTVTNYKARVQETTRSLIMPNGEVASVDLILMIEGDPPIVRDDRIDFNNDTYRVIGKKTGVDGEGEVHHVTLQCALWSK